MKSMFLAAMAAVILTATTAFAAGEFYVTAAQDFDESVGHGAVGVAVESREPGLYGRAAGEVGAIVAKNSALDYDLEAAAGVRVRARRADFAPFLLAGYRQWSTYDWPAESPETAYFGVGVLADFKAGYIKAAMKRYTDEWQPDFEAGVRAGRGIFAAYIGESPVNSVVVGVKVGVVLF